MSRRDDIFDESKSAFLEDRRVIYFAFKGLFFCPALDSTCCDMTRASLTTVIAFGIALPFLIPSIIIVFLVVLREIGSVSLTNVER